MMQTNPRAKETLVIGLGISGWSVAEYLRQKNIPFSMLDSRTEPPKLQEFKQQFPYVPVYTGNFSSELLSNASTIVLSPGISKHDPSIQAYISKNTRVLGDIELFAQENSKPVVAITGSNGKSTVTSLVGEMIKQSHIPVAVGGNLGKPALSLLNESADIFVLELSSFQLETTDSLNVKVGTILNICDDHMDRYHSLEEYYQAKARIFNHCEHIVVNRDDTFISDRIVNSNTNTKTSTITTFGLNLPKHATDFGVCFKQGVLLQGKSPILDITELKLLGTHNIANALAALSLGAALSLPMKSMQSALRTFKGLSHRCEWVRDLNDVVWINDSKGTNVGATLAALQGLKDSRPGKWILIAGGIGKNADFTPLKSQIIETCQSVILLGEAKQELHSLLSNHLPCFLVDSMPEAVYQAAKLARPGDGILLSPACASFDMFHHFEHRGDVFKTAVLELR